MANQISRAVHSPWVRIGAQVAVLEIVVLVGTSFAARFHPTSPPLDAIALGLLLVAGGTIGISRRWPVA